MQDPAITRTNHLQILPKFYGRSVDDFDFPIKVLDHHHLELSSGFTTLTVVISLVTNVYTVINTLEDQDRPSSTLTDRC